MNPRRKFLKTTLVGSVGAGIVALAGEASASLEQAGTWLQTKATNVSSTTLCLTTTGRATVGDGGDARYNRWNIALPPLDPAQEDISWFTSLDGARWVLAPNQDFRDAMFGALGEAGVDATPTLNAALAAPMVDGLCLTRVHYFGSDIVVPSGKRLTGRNRATCGLVRLTLGSGSQQASPAFGVLLQDAVNNVLADFFVDLQRSGLGVGGGTLETLQNRCSGVVVRGNCSNVFIDRVDVFNATGYAHYDSADTYERQRGIYRRNCRAFNSQVCFESTGNVVTEQIECEAHTGPESVMDGGPVIVCEAQYHAYAAVAQVRRLRCTGRGVAGAGDLTVTTGTNVGTVIMEECDIRLDPGSGPALIARGEPGFLIENYQVLGGHYESPDTIGMWVANSVVDIRGSELLGAIGILASSGAVVDIYGANVTAISPAANRVAIALSAEGNASVRWHGGGKLVASGYMPNAYAGAVTFIGRPALIPAKIDYGVDAPRHRQRQRGIIERASWNSYGPTPQNFKYWANIVLPTGVADRRRVEVQLTLRQPDNSVSWPPSDVALAYNWQSNSTIQIQISTASPMTGYALSYVITEWLT